MKWNLIDTAPSGYFEEVMRELATGKVKKSRVFVKQWCFVLLDGVVYLTHKTESGRWNGFCAWQKGDAWYPAHPKPDAPISSMEDA